MAVKEVLYLKLGDQAGSDRLSDPAGSDIRSAVSGRFDRLAEIALSV